jgi:hypothetical protein
MGMATRLAELRLAAPPPKPTVDTGHALLKPPPDGSRGGPQRSAAGWLGGGALEDWSSGVVNRYVEQLESCWHSFMADVHEQKRTWQGER